MRPFLFAAFAVFCCALAARADDTKPPQISEVKAGLRGNQVQVEARITDETGVLSAICHHRSAGGKVEATPMMKSDLDDTFHATFPGNAETEYWIEASDLLGNGPATYGSASKAFAVGSAVATGKAVASASPPRKKAKAKKERAATVAKASEPPVIEYSRPAAQPPEGREFTVRTKIRSDSPVAVAVLQARPQGTAAFTNT